ncbi:YhdH/YhfP family quinone oxidoreductase [Desulfuromonas sp. AOP6]|uniref:YhdH/YhfP family quinone oxidoreductase n=1 Tax=Desulfuromonas sp. AOP6 TaxID=1566351 RepID=UPI00127D86E0|nr:YhdH/YhfP family quinone oxidoreductase [Desulfuromonas sp. AOP6]BCA80760.1 quinone oxidoreductase [Desulfuromonas sp. AOP6]
MSQRMFKAMVVEEGENRKFTRKLTSRRIDELPPGDVLIKVHYSSLNYKDALSAIGNKGVSRNYPHTPGIDAAGEVVECSTALISRGQKVLVTGYDLGMNTTGGFGEYIRVPSKWVVPLPEGLSLRESMILGTAGFTAALSVWKLAGAGVKPGDGDILVTGATGGVGSLAVAILAKAGYRVVAATGKSEEEDYLQQLGASEVIHRAAVTEGAEKPMLKERWAGVVDAVGGETLAAALKATRYGGVVTCCGLVGSSDLTMNVFPFILRGVSLLGVDSVQCPMETRLQVWKKLAGDWKPERLKMIGSECSLDELDEKIEAILKGQVRGRTLVKILEP